jgi:large subunit ribosomal protein L21
MYAVLESGGFQFNVREGERIKIPKLRLQQNDRVTFDKVLFLGGEKTLIGTPYLENAKVEGRILGSGKEKKITVVKFKKRVKYRRKKGHRQEFTEVEIEKIVPPK